MQTSNFFIHFPLLNMTSSVETVITRIHNPYMPTYFQPGVREIQWGKLSNHSFTHTHTKMNLTPHEKST